MQTLTHPETEPQPRPENASDLGHARYIDDVGYPWLKFRHANLRDPHFRRLPPAAKVLWLYLVTHCLRRSVVDEQHQAWPVHEATHTAWLDLAELGERACLEGEDLRDAVHALFQAKRIAFRELVDGQLQQPEAFGDATQDLTTIIVGLTQFGMYEEGTGREPERAAQRKRIQRDRERRCHTDLNLRNRRSELALPLNSDAETTESYPQPRQKPQDRSGQLNEEVPPTGPEEAEPPAQRGTAPRDRRPDAFKVDKQAASLWDYLCHARQRHGLSAMVGGEKHRARAIDVWTDMLLAQVTAGELEQQIEARCLEALTGGADYANSNAWAHPGAAEISARMACQRRESLNQERAKRAMLEEVDAAPSPPLPEPEPEPEPELELERAREPVSLEDTLRSVDNLAAVYGSDLGDKLREAVAS